MKKRVTETRREKQTAPERPRVQTEKGKEKRKRRRLTGGRDRWETRAAATMMETRCRALQYKEDGEREDSEKVGVIEDDMIRGEKMRKMPTEREREREKKRRGEVKRGDRKKREADRQRERRMKRKKEERPA